MKSGTETIMEKSFVENRSPFFAAAVLGIFSFSVTAAGAEIHINSGDSFENAVENLNPGDTLIVHEGTYTDSGRISVQVNGTAQMPVVIKAAEGEQRPLITRSSGASTQNTINVEGAQYLTIQGLEISSNGGDGINITGAASYITLADLVVHDISVGLNFRSSMHHITVRGNHIYNTSDTGEGMYVGCNNAACAVTDSIFENNWIHNTLAAIQGDGIEIKLGSHSNVIRDNVIHDTNFPCILLYGTTGNPRNIVEGNVVWNCGDSGIQAAADAVIRNNIVLDSPGNGFNSQPHQGATPQNLEFVHNTVVGGSPCIRLNDWNGKTGLVFANNAVYCANDYIVVGGLGGVTVSGNVFEPDASGFPAAGYTAGRSEGQDFLDSANRQVYPTGDSALLDAGDSNHVTQIDFNGTARISRIDAGAYTWAGDQNPGWYVEAGFKSGSPAPVLLLNANPTSVTNQGSTTLTWQSSNVTSCQASGDWAGPRLPSGNEQVGPLSNDKTFTLTCSDNSSLTVSETVNVVVGSVTPPPTLDLSTSTAALPYNGSAMLSWTTTNADSCQASGSWSGPKGTAGNENTGPLTDDTTFNLSCAGAGGNITEAVSISVQPQAQAADSSSGNALNPLWITLMAIIARRRRRPAIDRRYKDDRRHD